MKQYSLVLTVLLVLGGSIAASRIASPSTKPREVVLIARQMAFYSLDGETANPTLVFRAGEQVRLTLRHQDPGFTHDLALKSLGVSIKPLRTVGSTSSVLFRVPDETGRHEYVCNPHSQMMKGLVDVQ